jgi:glucosyl-3-phosphoglycerate synthase
MTEQPSIDPALGLNLIQDRTLSRLSSPSVAIVIPAHNEQDTVAGVVQDCRQSLELLHLPGRVIVSASGCTDRTAERAKEAGAQVIVAPIGKGSAIAAALSQVDEDVVCLVDGDIKYYGDRPLAAILLDPIVHGIADATITDLYWRPLYPQMWLYGFFAPLAGVLFPELLPKVGSTPWSGQRAALRRLWPDTYSEGFSVDLEILLHWNQHALRLRPVLADDWTNPQRPKPDLMQQEFRLIIKRAVAEDRIKSEDVPAFEQWFEATYRLMASYGSQVDDPQQFEQELLRGSMHELRLRTATPAAT